MPRRRRDADIVELVTIPCQHQGCAHQATHHPMICVPMRGWGSDSHKPITRILEFKFCKDHVMGYDACYELRMRRAMGFEMDCMFKMNAEQKSLKPDYDRAYVGASPIVTEVADPTNLRRTNNLVMGRYSYHA